MELPIGVPGGGTGGSTITAVKTALGIGSSDSPTYVDGTFTGRVAIGGAANVHEGVTPSLEVTTSSRVKRLSGLSFFGDNDEGPIFVLAKSRSAVAGTLVFPEGGDSLGRIDFEGANPAAPRFDIGAQIDAIAGSKWTATNRETSLEFSVVAPGVNNLGVALTIQSDSGLKLARYLQMAEIAAPSAPPANGGRLFLEDNGSGKTRLMIIFATGVAQQVAIQP